MQKTARLNHASALGVSGPERATLPSALDAESQYLFILVPMSGGQQVLRTRLTDLLAIADPVGDVFPDLGGSTALRDRVAGEGRNGSGRSVTEDRARVENALFTIDGPGAWSNTGEAASGRLRGGARADASFADITIGFRSRTVTRLGCNVPLTPLEFDLLVALFDRKGAAASRSELLRDVWRGKTGVTTRTVDTHIFNLRQKLERDPSHPSHFVTVSKVGYRLKL